MSWSTNDLKTNIVYNKYLDLIYTSRYSVFDKEMENEI